MYFKVWSTSSLPLSSGLFWSRLVQPVMVKHMNQINVRKVLVLGRNNWNRITICKLIVLIIVTWCYNCLQKIICYLKYDCKEISYWIEIIFWKGIIIRIKMEYFIPCNCAIISKKNYSTNVSISLYHTWFTNFLARISLHGLTSHYNELIRQVGWFLFSNFSNITWMKADRQSINTNQSGC